LSFGLELVKDDISLYYIVYLKSFNRNILHSRLSDYGFTKLVSLFSAIDSTVEIVKEKNGNKFVQLKKPMTEHGDTSTKKATKGKKKVNPLNFRTM